MCLNLLRFNAVNYGKHSVVNTCPHFKRGGQEITWSSVFRVSYQKIIYFRCINDNCDSCEISRPWVLRNCCVVRSENSAFWCLLSFSIWLCMSVCLSVCLSLSMSVLARYLFIHLFISLLLLILLSLNTVLDLKETTSLSVHASFATLSVRWSVCLNDRSLSICLFTISCHYVWASVSLCVHFICKICLFQAWGDHLCSLTKNLKQTTKTCDSNRI